MDGAATGQLAHYGVDLKYADVRPRNGPRPISLARDLDGTANPTFRPEDRLCRLLPVQVVCLAEPEPA